MVASYFTNRLLTYDTKNGLKEYRIIGGFGFRPPAVEYHIGWSTETIIARKL